MLHDLDIGNTDVFHHQESGRTHHRRHQLAIDRTRHLDRRRLVRAVTHALHERNGEGAGGHHIGNRRARNDAGGSRRQHRRLGRPAAQVPEQRIRYLDEIAACPGLFEQGTKQYEQEDIAGRDTQGDAEYAFSRNPVVRHRFGQRHALVRDRIGHVCPGKRVHQHQTRDDRHGRADHPARGFQQQQHSGDGDGDVEGSGLPRPG